KRKAYEEKREQLKREREAQRNGTTAQPKSGEAATDTPTGEKTAEGDNTVTPKSTANEAPKEGITNTDKQNAAEAAKAEREKRLEERRKIQEERRKQALEAREAAKKQREEQQKNKTQ